MRKVQIGNLGSLATPTMHGRNYGLRVRTLLPMVEFTDNVNRSHICSFDPFCKKPSASLLA